MKVEIDAARVAELLHEKEDRDDREGICVPNHALANIIEVLDEFSDLDALKQFILRYGLFLLDIVSVNPFDEGLSDCHGELGEGWACGECGAVGSGEGG